jgi:cytochrome c oxidase subunit II
MMMDSTGSFLLPPSSSTIAPEVDTLFYTILGVSIFFFVIVISLAIFFTLKYRRRGQANLNIQSDHNTSLEIVWTVIPLIIVMIIFVMGFRVYLKQYVAPKDAIEIKVTAQRWTWNFSYPNGTNGNELVVPVGKPVKLLMSSVDVIHGFYIPDFRIKQDVLPNRYTTVWFEAPDPGEHIITCTQYCGLGHSAMMSKVRVLSQNEYAKWLAISASGPAPGVSPEKYGESLYKSKGCVSCHTIDGTASVGPTFKNLYGTKVALESDKVMTVDENYIRTCILEPDKIRVKGFPPVMPTFQGTLNDKDIDAIIAFIKSMSEESGEGNQGDKK